MTQENPRIAVLHFSHETVTFLSDDTTLQDFTYPGSPASGEALLQSSPRSYIAGFVKLAREHAGVELTGISSPLFPITGTGSGWVTREAFEHFSNIMIAELTRETFDGVYLALHGAMAVRGIPRPEAELARRVRAAVGAEAILAGTFDPHGNEDEEFLRHANLAFTVKYFPHYDAYLQGERAARTLIRAIKGDYISTQATRKIPIISPTVLQWTGASPWMDLVQRALVWEAREPDAYVNVFFGFPWADVPDVGMTIQALTNGNQPLADHIAEDMASYAWRHREALLNSTKIHLIPDAIPLTKSAVTARQTPIVLADHSDRSGAATFLLRALLDANTENTLIATIRDADAIAHLRATNASPGAPFDREVGGRIDPSAGAPVRITGTLRARSAESATRHWATIAYGRNNLLILTDQLAQIIEPSWLQAYGVTPEDYEIIALKSRVHFRRGFDDSGFAKTILLVEPTEPFLGTVRLDALPYENVDISKFYPYGSPDFP
jgi:microcystin degradation protein MlrC